MKIPTGIVYTGQSLPPYKSFAAERITLHMFKKIIYFFSKTAYNPRY
jgi:hypothetical protein